MTQWKTGQHQREDKKTGLSRKEERSLLAFTKSLEEKAKSIHRLKVNTTLTGHVYIRCKRNKVLLVHNVLLGIAHS